MYVARVSLRALRMMISGITVGSRRFGLIPLNSVPYLETSLMDRLVNAGKAGLHEIIGRHTLGDQDGPGTGGQVSRSTRLRQVRESLTIRAGRP